MQARTRPTTARGVSQPLGSGSVLTNPSMQAPLAPTEVPTAFPRTRGDLFSSNYSAPLTTGRTGATSSRPAQSINMTSGASSVFAPKPPISNPGNNLTNPGYDEQAFLYTQNRLMNDPAQGMLQNQYNQTGTAQPGEAFMNQNLGTLMGPGQGDQYWNQVSGQFQSPFAGEQFARQATQQFGPSGAASSFYDQAMGQYGDFTNYSGPGNTQGQYGRSSAALSNGTAGEAGLGALASQYGSMGQYNGPNLAAGQYAQTQGAFGDMPIANFDPFYDRARQLATQDYNRQAAGRGVYGSSEALSGVGNVITDIEAQRANRSFDAEMQRAQEQRARQQLLGEQARMGDLSSLAAFGANLSGVETFGNLNQAMGNLELNRHQTLGSLANMADSQALGAQNANIAGLNAFGNLASSADTAETNRFNARTNAMNQADRTGLDRMRTGADIAFGVDEGNRADYTASMNAANSAAGLGMDRTRLGADIATTLGQNDLNRLEAFNRFASGAEGSRQARQGAKADAVQRQTDQALNMLGTNMSALINMGQAEAEQYMQAEVIPALQALGLDQKQIDQMVMVLNEGIKASGSKE